MTVGNMKNTHLDYQAGIITIMLFNCWLSLHFWPDLFTNFLCCASFFIGFISATLLKI